MHSLRPRLIILWHRLEGLVLYRIKSLIPTKIKRRVRQRSNRSLAVVVAIGIAIAGQGLLNATHSGNTEHRFGNTVR